MIKASQIGRQSQFEDWSTIMRVFLSFTDWNWSSGTFQAENPSKSKPLTVAPSICQWTRLWHTSTLKSGSVKVSFSYLLCLDLTWCIHRLTLRGEDPKRARLVLDQQRSNCLAWIRTLIFVACPWLDSVSWISILITSDKKLTLNEE